MIRLRVRPRASGERASSRRRLLWRLQFPIASLAVALAASGAYSADHYTTNAELPGLLTELASRSSGLMEVETLATDAQRRSIPLVRAGSGRPEDPAVLLVAGLDGRHLIGTEFLRPPADLQDMRDVAEAFAKVYERRHELVSSAV